MPLEFNFPDGDRSGDAGILCIIHAFHWRPDWQRDVTYQEPTHFCISDRNCEEIARAVFQVLQHEVD